VLIQLARQLTDLHVIATASRDESRQWCLDLGAHDVINHELPLTEQLNKLEKLNAAGVDHVASLTQTDTHFESLVECLKPQGQFALIDDPKSLDVTQLKRKSLSLHWEFMFTRSLFSTPDMHRQGELLAEVSALIDEGQLRSTASENFGLICAANLKRAHTLIESGKARGKLVLQGF
jgi:zinc-binding alcohol dehydrogenase family protein